MLTYAITSAFVGAATRAIGTTISTYWVEQARAAAAANQEIVYYAVEQKERVEGKNTVVITTVYFLNQAKNIVRTVSNREVKPKPKKSIFGGKTKKQTESGEPDLSWLKDMGNEDQK